MSLDKAMQNLKYDSRLVEYNVRTGQLSKEELAKYMASLPDSAANSEKLNIEENSDRSESSAH